MISLAFDNEVILTDDHAFGNKIARMISLAFDNEVVLTDDRAFGNEIV